MYTRNKFWYNKQSFFGNIEKLCIKRMRVVCSLGTPMRKVYFLDRLCDGLNRDFIHNGLSVVLIINVNIFYCNRPTK